MARTWVGEDLVTCWIRGGRPWFSRSTGKCRQLSVSFYGASREVFSPVFAHDVRVGMTRDGVRRGVITRDLDLGCANPERRSRISTDSIRFLLPDLNLRAGTRLWGREELGLGCADRGAGWAYWGDLPSESSHHSVVIHHSRSVSCVSPVDRISFYSLFLFICSFLRCGVA